MVLKKAKLLRCVKAEEAGHTPFRDTLIKFDKFPLAPADTSFEPAEPADRPFLAGCFNTPFFGTWMDPSFKAPPKKSKRNREHFLEEVSCTADRYYKEFKDGVLSKEDIMKILIDTSKFEEDDDELEEGDGGFERGWLR